MEPIEYIEFQLVDILGRLKGMVVPCTPVKAVEDLREDIALVKGTSVDGSSITGLARVESSDLRLEPDKSSLIELPYTAHRMAASLCFVRDKMVADNQYYPKDTRGALHSVCDNLLTDNKRLEVKIEPEFYFITHEGQPFDIGEYADVFPNNPGADILIELSNAVRLMGMMPRVIHHEVGNAQQEIEIDYSDAKQIADFVVRFKNLCRAVTQNAGIDVSFMPKPFEGLAGSGLHCHLQLWQNKTNLFGCDTAGELSDTAQMFTAGLLEHAPAITAIANPTVNSYKRLVPHHEAPVYICWGYRNRTALIRVPLFSSSNKAAIEFRSPDATANPYLLFSAIIASGLDGIKKELMPPEPVNDDVFSLSDSQRDKMGIEMLPANLSDALGCLEEDKILREAIGSEIIDTFLTIKRKEWDDYTGSVVTDWEWLTYNRV